eukprot:1639339-Rhodomonas_salina.1
MPVSYIATAGLSHCLPLHPSAAGSTILGQYRTRPSTDGRRHSTRRSVCSGDGVAGAWRVVARYVVSVPPIWYAWSVADFVLLIECIRSREQLSEGATLDQTMCFFRSGHIVADASGDK